MSRFFERACLRRIRGLMISLHFPRRISPRPSGSRNIQRIISGKCLPVSSAIPGSRDAGLFGSPFAAFPAGRSRRYPWRAWLAAWWPIPGSRETGMGVHRRPTGWKPGPRFFRSRIYGLHGMNLNFSGPGDKSGTNRAIFLSAVPGHFRIGEAAPPIDGYYITRVGRIALH